MTAFEPHVFGPFLVDLPSDTAIGPRPDRVSGTASWTGGWGSYRIDASVVPQTLASVREFLFFTTKGQAKPQEERMNGLPGLVLGKLDDAWFRFDVWVEGCGEVLGLTFSRVGLSVAQPSVDEQAALQRVLGSIRLSECDGPAV